MNKRNICVSNTQGRYLRRFFIISKNVINFSKKFTIRHYLFIHVQHIDNLYMEEDYLYGH